MLKDLWKQGPHNQMNLKQQMPELAAAIEANDDRKIEQLVAKKMKEQLD